jgi:hypothetical protein
VQYGPLAAVYYVPAVLECESGRGELLPPLRDRHSPAGFGPDADGSSKDPQSEKTELRLLAIPARRDFGASRPQHATSHDSAGANNSAAPQRSPYPQHAAIADVLPGATDPELQLESPRLQNVAQIVR